MADKHITYIDGIRILIGYTPEEYRELLRREAQQQYQWEALREQERQAREERARLAKETEKQRKRGRVA